MKLWVPWLAFVACFVASAFLFQEKRRLSEELNVARTEQGELDQLKVQTDDAASAAEGPNELARLRTENAELHRLRNEVRTLKSQNSGSTRVQAVVQAALGGQPEVNAVEHFNVVEENAKLKTELEDLKADKNRIQAETCAQNLFMIQTAINQWALENRKSPGENVLPQNIIPYLKAQIFPLCPSSGTYSTRPYGTPPTCSFSGHGTVP